MSETAAPTWGGDPSIAWRILLTARPTEPTEIDVLAERLATLSAAQGWPAPPAVVTGDLGTVQRELAEVRDVPVVVGLAGERLVVSAFHAYVDGLGLLDVLAALTASPVTSSARGVGDRAREPGGALGRLREVAFAPPASVVTPGEASTPGDTFARREVRRPVRTAELVHAVAAAVVDHNAARRRRSRHVTVAVGVGRTARPGERLANRSELIRLRDLEGVSLGAVESMVRGTPLSAAGGTGLPPGRLATLVLRALSRRLGATMLVSHLGDVATSGAEDLAFHPVTAGGTGLALGAVGHEATTTLTLRGRGSSWDEASLGSLLERVADHLDAPAVDPPSG